MNMLSYASSIPYHHRRYVAAVDGNGNGNDINDMITRILKSTPAELSTLVSVVDVSIVDEMLLRVTQRIESYDPRQLINLLKFVSMRDAHHTFLNSLRQHLVDTNSLKLMKPHEMALLTSTYATLSKSCGRFDVFTNQSMNDFFRDIATESMSRMNDYDAASVVTMAGGFARARYRHEEWFAAISSLKSMVGITGVDMENLFSSHTNLDINNSLMVRLAHSIDSNHLDGMPLIRFFFGLAHAAIPTNGSSSSLELTVPLIKPILIRMSQLASDRKLLPTNELHQAMECMRVIAPAAVRQLMASRLRPSLPLATVVHQSAHHMRQQSTKGAEAVLNTSNGCIGERIVGNIILDNFKHYSIQSEFVDKTSSYYSIDHRLDRVDGNMKRTIFLEFDGIHHFSSTDGRTPIGRTLMKQFMINQRCGKHSTADHHYRLVSLPYYTWNQFHTKDEQLQFLSTILRP